MRFIGQYLAAMWADWVSRMSGLFSLIFTVAALTFEHFDAKAQAKFWAVAAVLCYVLASFWVWYKNRPDLIIEIQGTTAQINAFVFDSEDPVSIHIALKLLMVNTRPTNNAIKRYELLVKTNIRPLTGRIVSMKGLQWRNTMKEPTDLESIKYSVLTQGQPVIGHVCFIVDEEDESKIRGKQCVLTVTDIYNVSRKIKARISLADEDELIRTPPSYMNEAYRS